MDPRIAESSGWKWFEAVFGKEPQQGRQSDEVVAIGAAGDPGRACCRGDVKDGCLLGRGPPLCGAIETLGAYSPRSSTEHHGIPDPRRAQVFSTAGDHPDAGGTIASSGRRRGDGGRQQQVRLGPGSDLMGIPPGRPARAHCRHMDRGDLRTHRTPTASSKTCRHKEKGAGPARSSRSHPGLGRMSVGRPGHRQDGQGRPAKPCRGATRSGRRGGSAPKKNLLICGLVAIHEKALAENRFGRSAKPRDAPIEDAVSESERSTEGADTPRHQGPRNKHLLRRPLDEMLGEAMYKAAGAGGRLPAQGKALHCLPLIGRGRRRSWSSPKSGRRRQRKGLLNKSGRGSHAPSFQTRRLLRLDGWRGHFSFSAGWNLFRTSCGMKDEVSGGSDRMSPQAAATTKTLESERKTQTTAAEGVLPQARDEGISGIRTRILGGEPRA